MQFGNVGIHTVTQS